MKKVDKILNDNLYKKCLEEIKECEKDREFCLHNLEHFINMARISYIKVLEEGLAYSKDIIYSIGLLHDIGRAEEYKNNIPHHIASVEISKEILKDKGFSKEDIEVILKGIFDHRKGSDDALGKIVYESDKLSRECFSCPAEKDCKWSKEKKNLTIKY
ncbi:MAG: HD domain-containing protein [Clostridium sp.]